MWFCGAVKVDQRVEITDRESAQAWLETQDHQTQVWFACRCALRAVPALVGYWGDATEQGAVIATLRALLTSAASATCSVGGMCELRPNAASCSAAARSVARAVLPLGDTSTSVSKANAAYSATCAAASAATTAAAATTDADAAALAIRLYADATASAYYGVYAPATFDAKKFTLSGKKHWGALWSEQSQPDGLKKAWGDLKAHWGADAADWSFWIEWYEAILRGDPMDWNLIFKIATTLTDEDWETGAAHVAVEIKKIRDSLDVDSDFLRPASVPEIERKKITQHVERLLKDPEMTALAAEGAAEVLDRAIQEYLRMAHVNCLPDELKHLESLPPTFKAISRLVKSSELAEIKVAALSAEILHLNEVVARLEASLKSARAQSVQNLFTESAIKGAGTAFGAAVVGSLGIATSHFFGQWPGDLTLENFRGWLSEIQSATPAPNDARSGFSETTDV